jgi:hypothetical protein
MPNSVSVLLLQDLLQSCARGGRRRVEDMCYERRRAYVCVYYCSYVCFLSVSIIFLFFFYFIRELEFMCLLCVYLFICSTVCVCVYYCSTYYKAVRGGGY